MWIFTPDLFVSIVEHYDNPDRLVVRARDRASLERFLAPEPLDGAAQCTPDSDYRWRVVLPRETVDRLVGRLAGGIDYPNVKDAVLERQRATVMGDVWRAALALSDGPAAYYHPPRQFR